MKKGAQLALILGIGAAIAAISYYFLVWRPAHPKTEKPGDNVLPDGSTTNSGTGYSPNPTQSSEIGKKAYANKDGVRVVSVSTGETVRTKNINEFIGVVDGKRTLGGSQFYTVNGGLWAVSKNLVKLS